MSTKLPLDEMTVAEKLQLMEELWADLSQQPEQVPTPDWHRELLRERKRQADAGELKFLDWETTIAELKDELRGNQNL